MLGTVDPAPLRADISLADAIRLWPEAVRPLTNRLRAQGHATPPGRLLRELAADFGIAPDELLAEMRAAIEGTDCPWSGDCLCR
jgi:hypothetical protein